MDALLEAEANLHELILVILKFTILHMQSPDNDYFAKNSYVKWQRIGGSNDGTMLPGRYYSCSMI